MSDGVLAAIVIAAGAIVFTIYWRAKTMNEQLILAQTIYGEARGEGREGMEAVANVVMNRVRAGGWWGNSVIGVALKPWQFSAWNENDPNRAIIENKRPDQGDLVFDLAYDIAGEALRGELADRTGGATHYHTKAILPGWADETKLVADIGAHLFYKGIA